MHLRLNYIFFFLFIYLIFNTLNAYSTEVVPVDKESGIKGKVIDRASNRVVEYATIMVYSLPDSSFVEGGITNANGSFELKLKQGKYYLTVQFLGYHTRLIDDIEVTRGRSMVDLGNLVIAPDDALLEEVEVVAEKSTVEMTLDKRIFNIGKDISTTAGNAIEVLENIPSVTVDIEGNVSLRGDEGVRILIDGKVSGLAGINSRDALRSLQADMIDRIEVVTNPSVRYDAEGTAGIINIVLKKDRRNGFNGSIDLSTGIPLQYGVGINTNYRLNKVNFFVNYALNYRERLGSGNSRRDFFREDGTYTTFQDSERERKGLSNMIRTGAEYFITPNDVLTFSLMYRTSDEENISTVIYDDFGPGNEFLANSERVDNEKETDPNLEYSLDFKKDFAREDQTLTANFRYFNNSETENSAVTERISPVGMMITEEFQRIENNERESNFQFQVDYVHPFTKKSKFEAGVKYEQREIDNDYMVEEMDSTGQYVPLPEYTNRFIYDEKIFAAYLLYGNEVGRYSYQAGLRTEYSDISTLLRETDDAGNQNYFDFFPSLHLNYKLTEDDQLQLSYSRRIRRPGFWLLNPFRSFTDNRNIRTGNPNLKPIYTDSYELGYLRYWEKASLNFNTYYRRSTDVFQRIETVDSSGISYSGPVNFALNNSYGLELIGNISPVKWWNLNGNLNFFRSMTEGEANDIIYETDYYTLTGRLMSKFNIQRGFDMQLALNYRGPMDMPQGVRKATWSADFGASKDILKGQGTLTLSVRDIFSTRRWAFETFGEDFYSNSEFRWSTTTITLNFNYRINQQKKRNGQSRGDAPMMDDGEF
ncbi:MAG: TonB-dependent receptor [Bacteroidetes bacterium]|nr:TonB-dependent receptor [Bacteroidota bacterium]